MVTIRISPITKGQTTEHLAWLRNNLRNEDWVHHYNHNLLICWFWKSEDAVLYALKFQGVQ